MHTPYENFLSDHFLTYCNLDKFFYSVIYPNFLYK